MERVKEWHLPECADTEALLPVIDCICEPLRRCQTRVMASCERAVRKVLTDSEQINDLGMYPNGSGIEDVSERFYHSGLRSAIMAIKGIGEAQ